MKHGDLKLHSLETIQNKEDKFLIVTSDRLVATVKTTKDVVAHVLSRGLAYLNEDRNSVVGSKELETRLNRMEVGWQVTFWLAMYVGKHSGEELMDNCCSFDVVRLL